MRHIVINLFLIIRDGFAGLPDQAKFEMVKVFATKVKLGRVCLTAPGEASAGHGVMALGF